jgi:hypothetical protein
MYECIDAPKYNLNIVLFYNIVTIVVIVIIIVT